MVSPPTYAVSAKRRRFTPAGGINVLLRRDGVTWDGHISEGAGALPSIVTMR